MKDKFMLQNATNSSSIHAYESTDWPSLISFALEEAKRQGASDVEIGASSASGFTTTVRLGNVETIEFTRNKGIVISVYFGQQKGSASTSDTSQAALSAAIKAACDIAHVASADEYAGLAQRQRLAFDYPNLDLYHPWPITPEQGIELATECETIARHYDPRITNSEGATLSTHQSTVIYANSLDFYGNYSTTRHSLSCTLIGQTAQQMQRDYGYTVARSVDDLQSVNHVAQEAAEKTLRRLDARKLSTRKAPVIFAAEIAGSLLNGFINAIRGSNLYRKSSFLVDHLGKQIFPQHITIFEQPHLRRGLGSAPFDNDGVLTSTKHFIRDGILESYVLSHYSAKRLGLQTTGNAGGVFNLTINTSQDDLPALLRKMGTGLLVTELMGQGINLLTGDYSRGASGFWVENGEIQYPVEEVTIAGNLSDMFSNLIAVGNDVEQRGNIITGSLLIEQMMIAGS